jgi:hypothetical protein
LLVRVLLVVGGAMVVTGIGWLLGTASASADVLPAVPAVPSPAVVSSVTDTIGTPVLPASLPTPALRNTPTDLGQVTRQVHLAVSDVGDRVTPVTTPALKLVPLTLTVPAPKDHPATGTAPAVSHAPATQFRPETVVAHRHVPVTGSRPAGTGSTPAAAQHHMPVLPPLQPTGSSDAATHSAGGSAGGAGGAQSPFVTVAGGAPSPVGRPATPRLPVAPGQQPGTSPD